MSKYKYKKKYRNSLNLSERQLEQISALHIIDIFMMHNKLEELPKINPDFIRNFRHRKFPHFSLDEKELKKGLDTNRVKIRPTKKGYVVELKFNFRSKGINTERIVCERCRKFKSLNHHFLCKKCTEVLGGSKGVYRFWNKKYRRL